MRRQQKTVIKIVAIFISTLIIFALLGLSAFVAYEQSLRDTIYELHQQNTKTRTQLMTMALKTKNVFKQIAKLNGPCHVNVQEKLQAIAINDPNISVVFINDKHHICSNLDSFTLPKGLKHKPQINLSGPLNIKGFTEPAFAITQVINQKLFGLIFPQSVLLQAINNHLSPYLFSALYQNPNESVLLLRNNLPSVGLNSLSKTQILKNILHTDKHIKAVSKLAIYHDLYLVNAISNQWVIKQIKSHLILLGTAALLLGVMLISSIYRLTKNRLSLLYELGVALKNDEFIPHYQAVVDLNNEQICGVECLIRWQIDDETINYPDSFIDALINSPLIGPVTERLIEKIFIDFGNYCQQHPNFHLAINLTPTHFNDEIILKLATKLCQQYGVCHQQIIFELTEQNLIDENNLTAKSMMQQMREAGFELALDDFGTGYSNISYLQHFHFDYLKIDRRFIIAINTGAVTENITASIIHLANNMNMKIVAEGISDKEHVDYLKMHGVKFAQGFYYAKPKPIHAILKLLP